MSAPGNVATFFHDYAQGFNALYGNAHTPLNRLINRLFRRSMRLRFERTIAGCSPIDGKSVLDVGTGPGHYAVELARRGARRVVGLDFAAGMLAIARSRASQAGVGERCEFQEADFLGYHPAENSAVDKAAGGKFDYVIVMGVMDYVKEPTAFIRHVVASCRGRAFFSFPVSNGLLAWQRKLRYKRKCDLYLYSRGQVRDLFQRAGGRSFEIDRLGRDYFVTLHVGNEPVGRPPTIKRPISA